MIEVWNSSENNSLCALLKNLPTSTRLPSSIQLDRPASPGLFPTKHPSDPPFDPFQNGSGPRISCSPYETGIVIAFVGPVGGQRIFVVHQGILEQAPSLINKIHSDTAKENGYSSISLVDIDPAVFELVLKFLYTGKYQRGPYPSELFPPSEEDGPNIWPGTDKVFEMHSLLYCFAQEHEMRELSDLAQKNFKNMTLMPYRNAVDVARRVYPKLPEDDNKYREKFRFETRVAMKDNMNLIREPWILDAVKHGSGSLVFDLFTVLTEPLICDGEANDWEAPSQTARGKKKLVHLNGGHADCDIQEAKSLVEDEEAAFAIAQETADSPYEHAEPALEPEPEPAQAEDPATVVKPVANGARGDNPESSQTVKKKGKKGKKGNKCQKSNPTPAIKKSLEPNDPPPPAAARGKSNLSPGQELLPPVTSPIDYEPTSFAP
ncbi:hypothetical protein ACJ72_03489 [Emergomyces africanus]|uniref:BTB domain-containing protein n=1 Tax=Emergomyces africanus TaxID=1955775 RepID=A0A1B7NZG0_9EURO|nr:hypothetical protein ACJ72_03489 [Emergomyces africanus]